MQSQSFGSQSGAKGNNVAPFRREPQYSTPDPTPTTSQPQPAKQPEKDKTGLFVKSVKWLLIGVLGFVGVINASPYIKFVVIVTAKSFDPMVWGVLQHIPLLGGLLGWLGHIFTSVAGIVLWAAFQSLECLPLVLANRQKFGGKINKSNMSTAQFFAGVVYVLDFLLGWALYPPIEGGFEGLKLWIAAPSLEDVNWWNVLLIFMMLFAFELALKICLWLHSLAKQV